MIGFIGKLKPALVKAKDAVVDSEFHSWAGNVVTEAKITCDLVAVKITPPKTVTTFAAGTQFAALLDAPFSLYELGKEIKGLVKAKNRHERLDHCLTIATTISQLADDVIGTASALKDFSIITSALKWITPLSIASGLLSTANFAIEGRNIHYGRKMLNKMKKADVLADPTQMLQKHSYRLKTYCGINPKLVSKALAASQTSEIRYKSALVACNNEMIKRIRIKHFCQALNIVIAAISLVAAVILLASPLAPLVIAATALFGIATALTMTRRAVNLYSEQAFKKRMRALAA
jgi:hypothetical protein